MLAIGYTAITNNTLDYLDYTSRLAFGFRWLPPLHTLIRQIFFITDYQPSAAEPP